jgi:hypothetical protein
MNKNAKRSMKIVAKAIGEAVEFLAIEFDESVIVFGNPGIQSK